jgi:membrane protein implicated in regulation of membrane protease activity
MIWWHWLILGLLLVGAEAATGGFFIIFFGAAALLLGILVLFDLAGPLWMQWLLFSLFSVGSLVTFRDRFRRVMRMGTPAADVDSLIGELALPVDDIAPGAVGRAELRGTIWSARNGTSLTLARGQRCTVSGVDRLTVTITPEGARV